MHVLSGYFTRPTGRSSINNLATDSTSFTAVLPSQLTVVMVLPEEAAKGDGTVTKDLERFDYFPMVTANFVVFLQPAVDPWARRVAWQLGSNSRDGRWTTAYEVQPKWY